MQRIKNKAEFKLIADSVEVTIHAKPGTQEALLHKTYMKLIVDYFRDRIFNDRPLGFKTIACLGLLHYHLN